jgi:hypothetical protein
MASTGIRRSRRSAAQVHALASVEREIRTVDPAGASKYVRSFRQAFPSYQKVVALTDVRDQVAQTGVALVADYHALPNSQRYLASLLRDPELHRRPLVLGLETVFARDQHILDEWVHGQIDESELRQRIRFDFDWGYDWAPFYELLCAAREHGTAIAGLDCMPREDLRKIGARDRHAADKIAELRRVHPVALILVLFGESHLAPQHLPALLRRRLPAEPVLTVLQNVDALYWRAAGEACDQVAAVAVRQDVLCVFNATPLEKYEHYRLCLDRWGRGDPACAAGQEPENDADVERDAPDLGPTFYNLIEGLVRVLGINQYSPHNTTQPRLLVDLMPEVYSRRSDAFLRRLLSRRGFAAAQRPWLLRQVHERGSLYLAPINAVYVREFNMTSCAEEAARFLHHACRGLPNLDKPDAPTSPAGRASGLDDAFYVAVLEQAFAFFGSRILHPARPAVRDSDLEELLEATHQDLEQLSRLPFAVAVEAVEFLLQHRRGDARTPIAPSFAGRQCEYAAEQLGYLTGSDMYDAYLEGRLTTAAVRKLFLTHLDPPGIARKLYSQLRARVQA